MNKNNIAITVLSALIIAIAALLGVTMSNGKDTPAPPPEVTAYYSLEESVSVSSGPVADTTQAPVLVPLPPEPAPEPAPEGRVFEESIYESVDIK